MRQHHDIYLLFISQKQFLQHFEIAQTLNFSAATSLERKGFQQRIASRNYSGIQSILYKKSDLGLVFFFLPFLPSPFSVVVKAFVTPIAQLDATSSA